MNAMQGRLSWVLVLGCAIAVMGLVAPVLAATPPAGSIITSSVVFDSDLDLTGLNFTGTVYTAINAGNITIDGNGHTVTAPDANLGVQLTYCSNVTLRNLTMVVASRGIGVGGGGGNLIENCRLTFTQPYSGGCSLEICDGSIGNTVRGCTLAGNHVGIGVGSAQGNLLEGNDCSNCGIGIWLSDATQTGVIRNNCQSALQYGIWLQGSAVGGCIDTLIDGNDCSGSSTAVSVEYAARTTIANNRLTATAYAAIRLRSCLASTDFAGDGHLNSNDFTGAGTLLSLTDETGLAVENLDFTGFQDTGWTLGLYYCSDMVVRNIRANPRNSAIYMSGGGGNLIENCQFASTQPRTALAGLEMYATSGNTVRGCGFAGGGIYVNAGAGNAQGNVLEGNDCSNSKIGVRLGGTDSTQVVGNDCRSATQYGVWLCGPPHGCTDTLIDGNDCSGSATGVWVEYGTGTRIANNRLTSVVIHAILVKSSLTSTDFAGDGDLNGNDFTGAGCLLGLADVTSGTVENLDFTGFQDTGWTLALYSCSNLVVRNIKANPRNSAIYVSGGGGNLIENCLFAFTQPRTALAGLEMYVTSDNTVRGCGFAGGGIYVDAGAGNAQGNVLEDNDCSNSKIGIRLAGTERTGVIGNDCRNASQYGIWLCGRPCSDTAIERNDCSGSPNGVWVYRATGTRMAANRLGGAVYNGIFLDSCVGETDWASDGGFNGNSFEGTVTVLGVAPESGAVIEGLDFSRLIGFGCAITVYGSADITLRSLTVSDAAACGLFLSTAARVGVINCTITRCKVGVYLNGPCPLAVRNSIVWGNQSDVAPMHVTTQTTVTYSDIGGSLWPGLGNISQDPMFADAAGKDFHLRPNSPCIDTGDPCDPAPPGGGLRIDMGAFESPANHPPTVAAGGPYGVDEGSAVMLAAVGADPDGDLLTYAWDLDGDGEFDDGSEANVEFSAAELDGPSERVVAAQVTDPDGALATADATVTVANVAPVVGAITAPADPVRLGLPIDAGALFTDAGKPDTHTATWDWGDGGTSAGTMSEGGGSGSTIGTHTYEAAGVYTIQLTVTDKDGDSGVAVYRYVVINSPPTVTAGGPYGVDEGSAVMLAAVGADPDDDPLTYAWDLDGDGQFDDGSEASVEFSAAELDGPSEHVVAVQVTDPDGAYATADVTVIVANVAPLVGAITAPANPTELGQPVHAGAPFTDAGKPDAHAAVWDWGDGSTSAGTVTESNGSGTVSGVHSYAAAGVYTLKLSVTDDDGGAGEVTFEYVVVYDPEGGFVTGGGWIDSPAGAYMADSALAGKATFGFNAKYQKGASTPSGQAEFQFRVATLNFHSSAYEWLVVAGARAQFKGTGTINGAGHYGFLITAIDGQISGGGGVDKFRIKIWDRDNAGGVVYDNHRGESENGDAATAIGGGSIVIHQP